jgi:excisionase family DNA binding protein
VVRKYLTTKEAAVALGYHPNHLRRLLRSGAVVGFKQRNGHWLIAQREVERVLMLQTPRGRYQPSGW